MRATSRLPAIALAAAVVASASFASAAPSRASQARSRPSSRARVSPTPDAPDLYAGYSFTHAGEADLHGWALSGSYPLQGRLRLALDLTGHYGSFAGADLSQTALMGGVRAVFSWRGLTPFAEGLAGIARTKVSASGLSDADSDWGIALGGGLDYPLGTRWAARGLAHVRFLRGEGASDTDPRLSLGLVYHLGR